MSAHMFSGLSAYERCGIFGMLFAGIAVVVLGMAIGLKAIVCALVVVANVGVFGVSVFVLGAAQLGRPTLVFYRHAIVAVLVTGIVVAAYGERSASYLDLAALGLGLILVCGRIGCHASGCCHGTPHAWGIRCACGNSKTEPVPRFSGVRLFPVQLTESTFALAIVVVGVCMMLSPSRREGQVFAWCVVAYGAIRFCLEYLRGDPARPYLAGLSEAQWTSLVVIGCVVLGEATGALPVTAWHGWVPPVLVASAFARAVALRKFGGLLPGVLSAHHIAEMDEALNELARPGVGRCIRIARTSLGYQLSAGVVGTGAEAVTHYAISHATRVLDARAAASLARVIMLLRHDGGRADIVQSGGVHHVVVR